MQTERIDLRLILTCTLREFIFMFVHDNLHVFVISYTCTVIQPEITAGILQYDRRVISGCELPMLHRHRKTLSITICDVQRVSVASKFEISKKLCLNLKSWLFLRFFNYNCCRCYNDRVPPVFLLYYHFYT